jgi:hypothetical protein
MTVYGYVHGSMEHRAVPTSNMAEYAARRWRVLNLTNEHSQPCTTAACYALTAPTRHFTSPRHELDVALQLLYTPDPQHHGALRDQRCAHGFGAQLTQTCADEALERERAAIRGLQARGHRGLCPQQSRDRHRDRQW